MMHSFFAHSEEIHTGALQGIGHRLESPMTSLIAWIGLMAFALVVTRIILRLPTPKQLLAVSLLNLGYGTYLYNKSPGIGALAMNVGFILTLFLVIVGLQAPQKSDKPKE